TLQCLTGALPYLGTLDVHSNKVAVGKHLCETDGVFSLPASQFQCDRIGIPEMGVPASAHTDFLAHMRQGIIPRVKVFIHVLKGSNLSELLKLISLTHTPMAAKVRMMPIAPSLRSTLHAHENVLRESALPVRKTGYSLLPGAAGYIDQKHIALTPAEVHI